MTAVKSKAIFWGMNFVKTKLYHLMRSNGGKTLWGHDNTVTLFVVKSG